MCTPDVTYGMTPSAYRAFDNTKLGSPYGTSALAVGTSYVNGDPAVYLLVDNSAGTVPPFLPFQSLTPGGLSRANLVLTTTAHRSVGATINTLTILVRDFSWWILPE